ncbi:MAG TPA: hypothetical protein PK916_11140 [Bacteroidota bacterium]|nr:hypothetical protein [Bacteroidota bacterium]
MNLQIHRRMEPRCKRLRRHGADGGTKGTGAQYTQKFFRENGRTTSLTHRKVSRRKIKAASKRAQGAKVIVLVAFQAIIK